MNGAAPYAIPPDNPFAGGAMCTADSNVSANNCPEIYAWGFRNPWRWSFDSVSGTLWVGDVGQNAFEEIDQVRRGGNYGWDCREGTSTFGSPAASCASATGLIDPVHQYGRSLGFSVTGGYVYRGSALPALVGSYLFADYGSGRIWRLVASASGGFSAQELLDTSLSIASFGEGNDGELYVVDIAGGGLHKIVDGGAAAPPGPPVATLLSGTGCVNPQNPSQPASGLVPYHAIAPFWSDGATKERWLGYPGRHHDRGRRGRRFHVSERLGAHEAFPLERQLGRDATVHAPSGRRMGGLHIRVEPTADRRDARARRQDGADRRAELDLSERQRVPCVPYRGRGRRARLGDRAAQP